MSQSNVPANYRELTLAELPTLEPARTNNGVRRYISKVLDNVKNGVGLYLNGTGTGTGKTTSAVTILNEYVKARAKEHLSGGEPIAGSVALFVNMVDLQNVYNAQFRGTDTMKEQASVRYDVYKERMLTTELLVIDDIATRSGTESFVNEILQVVDKRTTQNKTMILTSNEGENGLTDIFGTRITSRILGACHELKYEGTDHRRSK